MPVPAALVDEIRTVSAAQQVDADEATRALSVLLDDDECIAYRVWGGPGFEQETVLLDVYVLGKDGLYNYCVFKDHSQGECNFLDDIESIAIVTVPDTRSPYVLVILTSASTEKARIFGASGDDLQHLEVFRSQVISAIRRNK